jgi:hypothetical protein
LAIDFYGEEAILKDEDLEEDCIIARVFVPGKPFQLSLTFEDKARSLP